MRVWILRWLGIEERLTALETQALSVFDNDIDRIDSQLLEMRSRVDNLSAALRISMEGQKR
jgi:uncharacterized coiled-coil protein SlyX